MSEKCPRCESPDPKLHPAMQYEGEVQICEHRFHSPLPPRCNMDYLKVPELPSELHQTTDWPTDTFLQTLLDAVYTPTTGLLAQLEEQKRVIEELRAYLTNLADNFDCDADGHRYGTYCRKCEAAELLGRKPVSN